jgi:hypothetical protein
MTFDVTSLLVPVFSGHKDEFGKEVVPPLPLLFDRVNGGRPPRSGARIFRLPFEVLGYILQQVDSSSLASLALVNRDCLQLARSRQFASVLLDYSDSSLALISKLLSEGREAEQIAQGSTVQLSLGACIRRIRVATNPAWITYRHQVSLSDEFAHGNRETQQQLIADANQAYFGDYLLKLQEIFSSRNILPHVELLDWEDAIEIPYTLFNALASSTIQHLKLFRVVVNEEFGIELPSKLVSRGWPLQTLHLEILWNFLKSKQGSVSPLCASILRLCAPTLISLTWQSNIAIRDRLSLKIDSSDPPQFPSLRKLKIGHSKFADSSSLNALLGSNLRLLIADPEASAVHEECFQKRGTIRSLESFAWESFKISADHPLDFLLANTQLLRLAISYPTPPAFLENKLLPLLSSSFTSLHSLSLIWQGTIIPNSALEIIRTITSLEQIHLSAGFQHGWRHDWLIDHEAMGRYLILLPNLKRIAFSRDSYDNHFSWSSVEHYYVDKAYHPEEVEFSDNDEGGEADSGDSDGNDLKWERLHREHMEFEAMNYISVMPKLEWIYLGQIPMCIMVPQTPGQARYPFPQSKKRDDCWTLLRRMFCGDIEEE